MAGDGAPPPAPRSQWEGVPRARQAPNAERGALQSRSSPVAPCHYLPPAARAYDTTIAHTQHSTSCPFLASSVPIGSSADAGPSPVTWPARRAPSQSQATPAATRRWESRPQRCEWTGGRGFCQAGGGRGARLSTAILRRAEQCIRSWPSHS